jgi:hypothetical protein
MSLHSEIFMNLLHMQSKSNEWCYEIVGKVPPLPRPMKLNHQLERSPIKI